VLELFYCVCMYSMSVFYVFCCFGVINDNNNNNNNQCLTMYEQNDMRSTTDKYTDGQQTNGRTVVKLRTNMS